MRITEGLQLSGVFFSFALVVVFLRRPDAILVPQFWAEDGAVWYAHAHNLGLIAPFFMTQDGYFSTYSRLVGAVAQALPLAAAPLLFALIAFVTQAASAVFFLSPRFRKIVPDLNDRLLVATVYLLLPNTAEIHGNATNAQWCLALIACMVVLADVGATRISRWCDAAVLLLAGLSGPFSLFLIPVTFFMRRRGPLPWRSAQLAILCATAAVQVSALLILSRATRLTILPQFSLPLLWEMLVKQVFVGGILGMHGYFKLIAHAPMPAALSSLVAVTGIALGAYSAYAGKLELRLFILFAALVLALSLALPNIGVPNSTPGYAELAWKEMTLSSSGARYWFFPILAYHLALYAALGKGKARTARLAAAFLLCSLSIGIALDFRDPAYRNLGFHEYAARFESAPVGTEITIPINPKGWSMTLVK
jgi:hypothetical protein